MRRLARTVAEALAAAALLLAGTAELVEGGVPARDGAGREPAGVCFVRTFDREYRPMTYEAALSGLEECEREALALVVTRRGQIRIPELSWPVYHRIWHK